MHQLRRSRAHGSPGLEARGRVRRGIEGFSFKPGVHVHYQETVLPVRDGLPKMKDLPAEMGGSGQTLPE
jgi:hypothetical protein